MRIYVVWGDSHIPYRSHSLPTEFIEYLGKTKPDMLVCTGDLVRIEVLDLVRNFGSDIIVVRGNMDEGEAGRHPLIELFEDEGILFMVFHGHGVYPRGNKTQLYEIAKRKGGVDVLLTGHTHSPLISKYRDLLIINPGSVCGVWGGGGGYGYPTWALLRVGEKTIDVRIYEIREGRLGIHSEKRVALR